MCSGALRRCPALDVRLAAHDPTRKRARGQPVPAGCRGWRGARQELGRSYAQTQPIYEGASLPASDRRDCRRPHGNTGAHARHQAPRTVPETSALHLIAVSEARSLWIGDKSPSRRSVSAGQNDDSAATEISLGDTSVRTLRLPEAPTAALRLQHATWRHA
jgi:hypothetical protein